MFCSALLVSDPKATSRCLQSLGRAALSVKCAAEIPVCQFKWHSPSSNACIFKSAAKCGKQGTHSYPFWKEHVLGDGKQGCTLKRHKQKHCRVDFSHYYPLLICWLFCICCQLAIQYIYSQAVSKVCAVGGQHCWRKRHCMYTLAKASILVRHKHWKSPNL